jgi:hypothetical protein
MVEVMKKSAIFMREKTLRAVIVVFVIGLLLSLSAGEAFAFESPKIPHAFYGDILIDGSSAPIGTKVEVKGTGVRTGIAGNPLYTTEEGKYGDPGDVGAKLIAQGSTIEDGTILTFIINDYDTGQTYAWEEGAVTKLDLEVTTTVIICELTTVSMEGGSVTEPVENPYSTACGNVVDITAVPDECYEFAGWTGDTQEALDAINDPTSEETFITLSDNYIITANFDLMQFNLNISSTVGGSVTNPGEGDPVDTYDCGQVVGIVAIPEVGYEFTGWTGDIDYIGNQYAAETDITMYGEYSITANFEPEGVEYCDLTTIAGAGGSISEPTESPFSVVCGTQVELLAVPDECYEFVNWTGAPPGKIGNDEAADTYIIVDGDYTITAVFELAGVEIPFNKGWNTFSTPVILSDCMNTWSEFIAINGLQVSLIYGYDSAAEYWVSPNINDEIQCGYGYYINANEETVAHAAPDTGATPSLIPLGRGVHLIGTPQLLLEDIDVASALSTVYEATNGEIGYVLVVSPYINGPNDWVYVRDENDPPTMAIGRAYWLVMENDGNYFQ